MRAVLDTSVFIAREQERPLGELPDEVAVSVVTLSELRHGVLAAADHTRRAQRLSTLEAAKQLGKPLLIDEAVGDELARLRVSLRRFSHAAGRISRSVPSTEHDARHEADLHMDVRAL